jgi:hypothetical protein
MDLSASTVPLFWTGAERGKVDSRRRFSPCRTLKIGFSLKAKPAGIDYRRESANPGVVALDGVIEIASRHGDPIFCAFYLSLQIAEIVIRPQLRVVLTDGK